MAIDLREWPYRPEFAKEVRWFGDGRDTGDLSGNLLAIC